MTLKDSLQGWTRVRHNEEEDLLEFLDNALSQNTIDIIIGELSTQIEAMKIAEEEEVKNTIFGVVNKLDEDDPLRVAIEGSKTGGVM